MAKQWTFVDVDAQSLEKHLPLVVEFILEQAGMEETFEPVEDWERRLRNFLVQVLTGENYFLRAAVVDGEPAGFVMFGVTYEPLFKKGRQGYIADLFVKPGHRGSGMEESLAGSAMETLSGHAVDTIQINVLVANRHGTDLWKSLGFEPFIVRMKRKP